jgi:hypothetical protein
LRYSDEYASALGRIIEIGFTIACGLLIQTTNRKIFLDMKQLRDDALEAGEARLTFIAKMR